MFVLETAGLICTCDMCVHLNIPCLPQGTHIISTTARTYELVLLHQKFKLLKRTTQIAIDLDMPLHIVQGTIKLWHEVGDVVAGPKNLSQAPIMSSTHIQVRTCFDCKHKLIHCSSFLHSLNIHQICIWMNLLKNLKPNMVLWSV